MFFGLNARAMETLIAIKQAFGLLLSGDSALFAIIFLSLKVNLTAVGYAALLGFPMGRCWRPRGFMGIRCWWGW